MQLLFTRKLHRALLNKPTSDIWQIIQYLHNSFFINAWVNHTVKQYILATETLIHLSVTLCNRKTECMIWIIHRGTDCYREHCLVSFHWQTWWVPWWIMAGHEYTLSKDRDCSICRRAHTLQLIRCNAPKLNWTELTEQSSTLRNNCLWERSGWHVRWDKSPIDTR